MTDEQLAIRRLATPAQAMQFLRDRQQRGALGSNAFNAVLDRFADLVVNDLRAASEPRQLLDLLKMTQSTYFASHAGKDARRKIANRLFQSKMREWMRTKIDAAVRVEQVTEIEKLTYAALFDDVEGIRRRCQAKKREILVQRAPVRPRAGPR